MTHAPVRAFTLIEMLVVLVIIGMMAAAIVMVGSDNRAAIARDEIEQLNAKLKLAQEEAQLYGAEYGLVISETDYQFVTFDDERWTPISDDRAYRTHPLPDGFELALEIEGFKLPGARLPGAKITDDGKIVAAEPYQQGGERANSAQKQNNAEPAEPTAADASEERRAAAANGDDDAETAAVLPQVFLLSGGELNPFVLAIGNRDDQPVFYRLRGDADGCIEIEGPIYADPVDNLTEPWENPNPDAIRCQTPDAEDDAARVRDTEARRERRQPGARDDDK